MRCDKIEKVNDLASLLVMEGRYDCKNKHKIWTNRHF